MSHLDLSVEAEHLGGRVLRRYALAIARGVRAPHRLPGRLVSYCRDGYRLARLRAASPACRQEQFWPVSPQLWDQGDSSGHFGMYCYQDSWAFRHLLDAKPTQLVDIASSTYFVAFAAQVTQVISLDIRLLRASLPTIECRRGDATQMPFADASVCAISTLSVIEHIGLGRYGDPLDPAGMEKAARELSRVLARGGMLLVAFPTARANVVVFNAHRVCTPERAHELFRDLQLVDEKYAMEDRILSRLDYEQAGRPYAYGCFRFTRA